LVGFICVIIAACGSGARNGHAPVLLFSGTGTTSGDVAAIETILDRNHLAYATATSAQLNRMTAAQLLTYRLVIVPGGNFIDMGASLTPQTATKLRNAVQQGVSYLGICAGAFLAGDGRGYYNSLNLTSGVRFGFYSAETRGIRKAAIAIADVHDLAVEQYWEDGPELAGWGNVVAKYPDGTPAISEGASGNGWVILSGVHPEAPESWRRGMTFTTSAAVANALAGILIQAALTRTSLPHF
jgi:glutamine amidotransferase-like uncharacterized protein